MDASLYAILQEIRDAVRTLVRSIPPADRRRMHHEHVSPLLWHLGHMLYIEQQWVGERLAGLAHDDTRARLYRPDGLRKSERAARMPDLEPLDCEWTDWQQRFPELLTAAESTRPDHPLLACDFILRFLIQHHGQHLETMHQALVARALARDKGTFRPAQTLRSATLTVRYRAWTSGHGRIGDDGPDSYDNERPSHDPHLPAFAIAERPVSNAAYLRFMEDDGYRDDRYWTHESRHWRDHAGAEAPWHWRRNGDGRWYGVNIAGPIELAADAPVSGLCAYEARAFARYAHARLPHEAEWELAMRDRLLLDVGSVWEWCENRFYPYPGFRAFPYRGYSVPWFDGAHTTLRGASVYSAAATRRASFRNFHAADRRHIFAGVRLCHPSCLTH